MRDRYDGAWYRTLTFVQTTTHYDSLGNESGIETWYESMQMPGKLRIDIAPASEGPKMLFRNDTLFRSQNGRVSPGRPLVHGLLLMGFDVYHIPVSETLAKLEGLGVDLSKIHESTWQGRDVWVIGAEDGDETSLQFWIDKERLVFVRQLHGAAEVQFNLYERLGGGWIAPEARFFADGRPTLLEEYADLKIGMTFEDGMFDLGKVTVPAWVAEEEG